MATFMKLTTTIARSLGVLTAGLIAAVVFTACGSKPASDPQASAIAQERERLLTENQELAQVRTENEEVRRLRKKIRSCPSFERVQEATRLKKDNLQLRQQIAKLPRKAPPPKPRPPRPRPIPPRLKRATSQKR